MKIEKNVFLNKNSSTVAASSTWNSTLQKWWDVTEYIFSSTVIKHKFEVLVFHLSVSILCYVILPFHNMSKANIALSTLLHLSYSFGYIFLFFFLQITIFHARPVQWKSYISKFWWFSFEIVSSTLILITYCPLLDKQYNYTILHHWPKHYLFLALKSFNMEAYWRTYTLIQTYLW